MSDPLEEWFATETFETGGRALFDGLQDARDPADVHALVVEACRVQDRLDRLHRLSSRDDDTWGRILPTPDNPGEFVLRLGPLLQEQRQTEVVFKQLTAEIWRRRSAYDDDDADEEGGLADL